MKYKVFGLILILLSGILLSFKTKQKYETRIRVLEKLIEDLNILKTEVSFLKTALIDIIEKLKNNSDKSLKSFYSCILDCLNKGHSIKTAFYEGIYNKSYDLGLTKRDQEILNEFSNSLGCTDYENQIENILAARDLLTFQLNEAKCDQQKNQKSKCAFIICGFTALGIVLI